MDADDADINKSIEVSQLLYAELKVWLREIFIKAISENSPARDYFLMVAYFLEIAKCRAKYFEIRLQPSLKH